MQYDGIDNSEFVNNILSESYICINESTSFNLSSLSTKSNISLFIDEYHLAPYKTAFNYPNFKINSMERNISQKGFDDRYDKLITDLHSNDRVVFLLKYNNDAQIINDIVKEYEELCRRKLIVLLHTTPMLLDEKTLQSITIIGGFTKHQDSYFIDTEVLLGEISPKPISNLPISLGFNGRIYDHRSSDLEISPANEINIEPFYLTEYEKLLDLKNIELGNIIKSLEISNSLNIKKVNAALKRVNEFKKISIGVIILFSFILFIIIILVTIRLRKFRTIKTPNGLLAKAKLYNEVNKPMSFRESLDLFVHLISKYAFSISLFALLLVLIFIIDRVASYPEPIYNYNQDPSTFTRIYTFIYKDPLSVKIILLFTGLPVIFIINLLLFGLSKKDKEGILKQILNHFFYKKNHV